MRPQAEAPAIDRGLAILEVLNETAKGMTLTEISKVIGSPKNSTSRLIQAWIAKDYVVSEECQIVLNQGDSCDWEETDEGVNCVAAPIRDSRGTLVAAAWASGIAGLMPKSRFPTVANEVKSAAAKIERRLRL